MKKINVFLFILLITLLSVLFMLEDKHTAKAFNYEKGNESTSHIEQPIVTPNEEANDILSDEDAALIARIAMAEAEGESEYGKRLVIDVVLNRVKHPNFPNTVREVVYQSGQFSPVWNGRLDRCYVRDDILRLVQEESISQSNSEVIFFNARKYSAYGAPLFQVGNHCFSSYK